MKAYKKYKDSGVSWIGMVPEHWTKMRYKDILKPKDEKVEFRTDLTLLSLTKKGVIVRNLKEGKGKFPKDFESYKVVYPNDLILCLFDVDETPRTVGLAHDYGMITGAYDVFDVVNCNREYIYNLYLSFDDKKDLKPLYKGLRKTIPLPALLSSYVYLPPKEEQEAIVRYLDQKVGQIDGYVAAKEKQLELLDELKQKIIADAVTGKCPEAMGLGRTPQYKPTNIPWIPEIPEHWEVNSIRYLFKEANEKTEDGSGELLSLSQYTGVKPKSECEKTGMFEAESTVGYNVVHKGQFVMNIMLAWNGSYSVSDYDGIISPSYCVFDFIVDVNKKYYDYLLRMKSYAGAFKTLSKGVIDSRLRLYPQYFRTFSIPIPPKEEQDSIVAYIDKKVSQIAKLRCGIEAQIKHLKEYKQTIISDAVTGKVKVPGV